MQEIISHSTCLFLDKIAFIEFDHIDVFAKDYLLIPIALLFMPIKAKVKQILFRMLYETKKYFTDYFKILFAILLYHSKLVIFSIVSWISK